jgi:hypothetical protein
VWRELENRALGLAIGGDSGGDSAKAPREVMAWMGRVTRANRKFGTSGIGGRRTKSFVLRVVSVDPPRS